MSRSDFWMLSGLKMVRRGECTYRLDVTHVLVLPSSWSRGNMDTMGGGGMRRVVSTTVESQGVLGRWQMA